MVNGVSDMSAGQRGCDPAPHVKLPGSSEEPAAKDNRQQAREFGTSNAGLCLPRIVFDSLSP